MNSFSGPPGASSVASPAAAMPARMRGWRGSPLGVKRCGRRAAMSRVVVIGATGHIGSYLVPRLVRGGHEVMAVSRGERKPYHEAVEWRSVQQVDADRAAEEVAGIFGRRIAGLQPDAVVD